MPLSEQERPCFFKIQVSKLDAAAASAVVRRTVRPGSEIRSDALRSFRAALREGYTHHYQVFDKDSGALRWVHTPISNLKVFSKEPTTAWAKSICKATLMSFASGSTVASAPPAFSQACLRRGCFQYLELW